MWKDTLESSPNYTPFNVFHQCLLGVTPTYFPICPKLSKFIIPVGTMMWKKARKLRITCTWKLIKYHNFYVQSCLSQGNQFAQVLQGLCFFWTSPGQQCCATIVHPCRLVRACSRAHPERGQHHLERHTVNVWLSGESPEISLASVLFHPCSSCS